MIHTSEKIYYFTISKKFFYITVYVYISPFLHILYHIFTNRSIDEFIILYYNIYTLIINRLLYIVFIDKYRHNTT